MSERRQTLTKDEVSLILEERTRELRNIEQMEQLTNKLATTLLDLNSQLEILGGNEGTAGQISTVTQNWIQIVRAISLAANSMALYSPNDFKKAELEEQTPDYNPLTAKGRPTTERLVRCAVKNGVIYNDNDDLQD